MRMKKLPKKRRLKSKTNYSRRLILLKSNKPRFVVRKTNKYLILQIVESVGAQDKVIHSVITKELLKQGWPENKKGSLKSLAASYLGGFLLGKRYGKGDEVILDIGLIPSTKSGRVYSAVKGLADSGVNIKFDHKIAPNEERISSSGKLEANELNEIKGNLK